MPIIELIFGCVFFSASLDRFIAAYRLLSRSTFLNKECVFFFFQCMTTCQRHVFFVTKKNVVGRKVFSRMVKDRVTYNFEKLIDFERKILF